MQTIAAAAGYWVVKRKLQIIVAKEPVEGRPCLAPPVRVSSYSVCLQAGRNSAGGFNRLLIETRFFTTVGVKALRADRYKVASRFTLLLRQQPVQCLKTD